MGMYTELIFGAKLKKNTPEEVIETLICMIERLAPPVPEPISSGKIDASLFMHYSTSFAVSEPQRFIVFDDVQKRYIVSTRSSIKNYDKQIETFLEWIKPYIEEGSGAWNMYAIVIYERFAKPDIYYLDDSGPEIDI